MKNTSLFTYSKHSGTFANRKYEELSYPKNQIICDPIIVNPVAKMRPHPARNKSGRVSDICIIISTLKDTLLKHSMTVFAIYSKEFLHAQPNMMPLWVKILLSVLNTPGEIKICNFYP